MAYTDNTSNKLGICHYCGRLERSTRDHMTPKRLRVKAKGQRSTRRYPTVTACWSCQQLKADQAYEDFRSWLLSDQGYNYLLLRLQNTTHLHVPVAPCQVALDEPEFAWFTSRGSRERHFCALHKPCPVLRQRLPIVGEDARSIWDITGLIPSPKAERSADSRQRPSYRTQPTSLTSVNNTLTPSAFVVSYL